MAEILEFRTQNAIGTELLEAKTEADKILAKYSDGKGNYTAMTAEDETQANSLMDKVEKLSIEKESADKASAFSRRLGGLPQAGAAQNSVPGFNSSPVDMSTQGRFSNPKGVRLRKSSNLRNFPNTPDGMRAAYAFSQSVIACLGKDLKRDPNIIAEAEGYCKDNGIDYRALSENGNVAGGYLVAPEFEDTIIVLREKVGMFKPNAYVMPMSSDAMLIPRRTAGLTAYFLNENIPITDSTMSYSQVNLQTKKLGALAYYPAELGADAFVNVGDILAGEIGYAFGLKEDKCGFNGDGTSTYGGIKGVINQLLNLGTAGVAPSAATSWATITLAEVMGLIGTLTEYADTGDAKLYCTRQFFFQVLKRIAMQGGGNTAQTLLEGFQVPEFAGIPVVFVQVLPTKYAAKSTQFGLTTSGQVPLIYGNLPLSSTFGDRAGVSLLQTNIGGTAYVNDQLAIRGIERFDINVHDVGDSVNAGPITCLQLS